MINVVHFNPKAETPAEANLHAFIETAKPLLKGYPAIASWEANNWDLRGAVERSGAGYARISAAFTAFDVARKGTQKGGRKVESGFMSEPFLNFAKAYFLYCRALAGSVQIQHLLVSLRVLEKALVDAYGNSAVHRVTPVICDEAARLIQKRYESGAAYRAGCALKRLAAFISENRLANPFQWASAIGRPSEDRNRVGKKADKARAEKMPSQAALEALPQCFNMATDVRDVLASSVAALLCTAPDRIGEVFGLRVDCEVDDALKGRPIYGLRWYPEKGAEPTVKWIAPTMVEVAKAAITKLRVISQPAREIATWYERNPSKVYLPPGTEYLRSQEYLTADEVARILGIAGAAQARTWLKMNGIEPCDPPAGTKRQCFRFDQFEAAVLAHLPKGFPLIDDRTGLKYSEALVVVRKNELHGQRGTILCLVEPVTINQVNETLGTKPGVQSIFDRFGFTEPDGNPINVSSHQFRHWLNTLAHRGGMSQLDIAKWSGRTKTKDNPAYNNMAPEEFLSMARELAEGDDRLFGGLAELASKVPISRDEFMVLEIPTAHTTELGFCVHDFTMLPCQKHRDCVNCNEHICIKGDRSKTARVKSQLELAEEQLRQAKEAVVEGYYGAERWQEHHQATVARLRNLVGILEDPTVPEGSLVRLTTANEFSPIRLAIQDRIRLEEPCTDTFDELQALLGGE